MAVTVTVTGDVPPRYAGWEARGRQEAQARRPSLSPPHRER